MNLGWYEENAVPIANSVGVDEVGRGPLAGPVVAAVVWISREVAVELEKSGLVVRDSKKMTANQRKKVVDWINARSTSDAKYSVALASAEEIDEINILKATLLAMERAYQSLPLSSAAIALIDGNKAPNVPNARTIVKGDDKVPSISLASIMAKEYRDDLMRKLAREFPEYGWETNVGYGTAKHIEAIRKFGLTPLHRKTFCSSFI
jgi:ribonuclease HII